MEKCREAIRKEMRADYERTWKVFLKKGDIKGRSGEEEGGRWMT